MREMLVFLEYLDTGLVPIKGFQSVDIEDFEKGLNSLSREERRKVNRKFRKIFRRLCKEKMKSMKSESSQYSFKKRFGVGELTPSKIQLKSRRRFVHDAITREIIKRMLADEF